MIRLKLGSARAELLLKKAEVSRSRRPITNSDLDMARHTHTGDNCSCGWKKSHEQKEKELQKLCGIILQCGIKPKGAIKKEEDEALFQEMMVDAGMVK